MLRFKPVKICIYWGWKSSTKNSPKLSMSVCKVFSTPRFSIGYPLMCILIVFAYGLNLFSAYTQQEKGQG